jgi:hypothetical protein
MRELRHTVVYQERHPYDQTIEGGDLSVKIPEKDYSKPWWFDDGTKPPLLTKTQRIVFGIASFAILYALYFWGK